MLYSKINNKEIGDLNYENELIPFFVEKAFFGFMDAGRKAFEQQAYDQIDNFATHLRTRDVDPRIKTFSINKMPDDQFQKLTNWLVKNMVDGFIMSGSEGLRRGIMTNYDLVYGVMRGHTLA